MKVLGLISSPDDPASRARIIQYEEPLRKEGIDLEPKFFSPLRNNDPAPWTYRVKRMTGINEWRISNTFKLMARLPLLVKQYKYDLIWQNRLLLPQHFYFEKKFTRPLVFDFDDAIWMDEGEKEVKTVIAKSSMVFAGNEYLANYANKLNRNVHIIPTTVDTSRLHPQHLSLNSFNIGWMGSKSNFPHLELIRPAIGDFLAQHRDVRFIVVSSEKPPGFQFDNERVLFRQWNAEEENKHINEFSIGVMPLEENEYTLGKCSYKMLQYMACGKPVVVSPVGTNRKILDEDEPGLAAITTSDWLRAFIMLKNDVAYYRGCASRARNAVERKYDCATWALHIATLFNRKTATG